MNRGYHDHVDRKYGSCSQLCSGGDVAKSRTVYWTAGMDVHEGDETNITVMKKNSHTLRSAHLHTLYRLHRISSGVCSMCAERAVSSCRHIIQNILALSSCTSVWMHYPELSPLLSSIIAFQTV